MNWIRRLYRRGAELPDLPATLRRPGFDEEMGRTEMKMSTTLSFALKVRDPESDIVGHCTLVALIANGIAEQMNLADADRYILDTATRLHEIGMVSVPESLIQRRTPLTTAELKRVRRHAAVGAAIVRPMHHPRVAWLIEHQYEEHHTLAYRGDVTSKDLLLAGIFRVADVRAAVTSPRPYQEPMPTDLQIQMLEMGSGSRFHPAAVKCAVARLRST